jgi:hypothetical protein
MNRSSPSPDAVDTDAEAREGSLAPEGAFRLSRPARRPSLALSLSKEIL